MAGGRLHGKVAIVTGGAGGIGSATASLFVNEGASVVVADVRDQEGGELTEKLGPAASYCHLDVTDAGSWREAVEACHHWYGPVSVLVSNAGVMVVSSIESATSEDFELAFRVNVIGVVLGIQAVVPDMRAIGGGSIVIVSSAASLGPAPGLSAYAASKAGCAIVSKCAAIELGHNGIRVNSVHPGGVDTAMSRGVNVHRDRDASYRHRPIPRIGQPEEIARMLVFLASDESSFSTGDTFLADGGLLAGPAPL